MDGQRFCRHTIDTHTFVAARHKLLPALTAKSHTPSSDRQQTDNLKWQAQKRHPCFLLCSHHPVLPMKPETASGISTQGNVAVAAVAALWLTVRRKQVISPDN